MFTRITHLSLAATARRSIEPSAAVPRVGARAQAQQMRERDKEADAAQRSEIVTCAFMELVSHVITTTDELLR